MDCTTRGPKLVYFKGTACGLTETDKEDLSRSLTSVLRRSDSASGHNLDATQIRIQREICKGGHELFEWSESHLVTNAEAVNDNIPQMNS